MVTCSSPVLPSDTEKFESCVKQLNCDGPSSLLEDNGRARVREQGTSSFFCNDELLIKLEVALTSLLTYELASRQWLQGLAILKPITSCAQLVGRRDLWLLSVVMVVILATFITIRLGCWG